MKKLEYYTIRPSLKQFYGIKVDEKTKFDESTEDGAVFQHFEDLTLTTKIERKAEASENNPFDIKEESTMTIKVPTGTILIWDEKSGFIIPEYQMTTLSDLEKEIEEFKDIYKDSKV